MNSQKFRISKTQKNGISLYQFNSDLPEQVNALINEYQKLILEITSSDNHTKWLKRKQLAWEIQHIKQELDRLNNWDYWFKNVLSKSSQSDNMIWSWQDSHVYWLWTKYVYKEWKEWNEKNIEYLRKKYLLLKRFLWNIIPKSYFVYGESLDKVNMKWMWKYRKFSRKSITVQRKIDGKNAQQMTQEEKNNPLFLLELEKAHKKYILLKFLLQSVCQELWFAKKTLDSQLDLWPISKMDSLHIESIDFIEAKITSPNIMWDEATNTISFIDFWYWEWDEEKEAIFQEMLKDDTLQKWSEICHHIWLE